VERFKREFEVNKLLPHDHIVEVLDFAELSGDTYALIMEYLFGEELRQTLDRENFIPPGRIVRLISQIAVGLDKAHARKLVHRDLKPDNVFLCQTPDGDIVKLLDFGSVKDNTAGSKKLTVMGTTIGSPYYMSPEQAQGLDTLDHRADVWALAAIMFECMAGRVPFFGGNGPQILLAILTKEPPLVTEVGEPRFPIPPKMGKVLGKALKKTASLRYENVGQLADAIGHAYGLSGNHEKWAETPEGELSRAISGKLDSILNAPESERQHTAQDSFFGEDDPLAEGHDTMADAMQTADEEVQNQKVAGLGSDSRSSAGIWVMVALGVALLGVGAYFLF
jgi:serine/threonine-protein kinase